MIRECVVSHTESVCPECLQKLPAKLALRGDQVFQRKVCPAHGLFETVVWRGHPDYVPWDRPKIPSRPLSPATAVDRGCPWDCGLCPDHRQHTCTALLEITWRCDLNCSFCFADAGRKGCGDPERADLSLRLEQLAHAAPTANVQLSGGEPTLRDDLPEIIAMARSFGFQFVQLNTNGVRLGGDASYVKTLKEAGLASVFLQFDGIDDSVHRRLRGRRLFLEKRTAVEHCAGNDIGVVLVPTLVPGVNVHQIGPILEFALAHAPTVRGVHFQPVSYFGRYPHPPADEDRITIPEVIRELEVQTHGKLKAEHFHPPGCENARCSFHGNFVIQPGGDLAPLVPSAPKPCCGAGEKAEEGAVKARHFVKRAWSFPSKTPCIPPGGLGLGGWEAFAERVRTHSFSISGMAFMDAWNLDLQRLRDCCIHVVSGEGRLIPFCAYNLTDRRGRSIHRGNDAPCSPT